MSESRYTSTPETKQPLLLTARGSVGAERINQSGMAFCSLLSGLKLMPAERSTLS